MLNVEEMPVWDTESKKCWQITLGKMLLSGMVIFGLLFPDFIWNGDTVSVTDGDGNDVTAEMSGQEIYEGIYEAENITFTISWLN
ncbi:MAG: hypothetical protein K2K96_05430 [Lachnospiraceae bacterium]|nr:hypothetical protein [Lachnospiraceae bacterium]